ncbi:MAG: PorT family protein [Ferruginibacter sp.]|nr:PorT family protein [Ferruginibacter sp.]
MKKIWLIALVVFSFASTSLAQSVKGGVKIGADLVKIDGKSFKEQFAFGYQVGGFVEFNVNRKFSIQPEVLFSQVSLDTSNSFSDIYAFESLTKIKLSYIKIPLMFNYKANEFVSLQIGPQYGILIDQNISLLSNGKKAFKQGDFSLLGGMQLNISRFIVYGRYGIGLSELNDIDNRDKWKNQTIQLGLGMRF